MIGYVVAAAIGWWARGNEIGIRFGDGQDRRQWTCPFCRQRGSIVKGSFEAIKEHVQYEHPEKYSGGSPA